MRRLILSATGLAIALIAADARAKCAMPGAKFEPESGVLPTAPVLRLFLPPYWAPASPAVTAIDATGKKLTAALTVESTADAFTSYRVAFPSAGKGPLHVRFVDKNGSAHDASYTVDPGWKAPAFAAPKLSVDSINTSWICSHQLTRNVRFASVAPAYRLTFAGSKAGLPKSTKTLVLPADAKTMFGGYATTPIADLALGHANCMGNTYPWSGGTWARITALFADGSESEVTPAVWLDPP